jgi:molecular chaperone DnaJ
MGFMQFQTVTACGRCNGQGRVITDPCKKCKGNGRVRKNSKIQVEVPAGVDTGSRLRIPRKGDEGINSGPPGDLYVVVYVNEHKFFKRNNYDIYCEIPIAYTQAARGDTIKIPTIDGKAKLKVPSGTQTHTILRMKGKGIPFIDGRGRGDQYVRVIVTIPRKVTRKHKSLYKKLDEINIPLKEYSINDGYSKD